MKERRKLRTWAGGFVAGFVVLLALGLIVRTFFVQGLVARVETASGSMAPWLFGPHGKAKCDSCHFEFAFDALDSPAREVLDCPNCGGRTAYTTTQRITAGEQVLVDRRAYSILGPRRWDPVVFQCVEEAGELCIKRVVGLPGEEVQVRDGDVYVHGQIARKSLAEQRDMALLAHDSRWRVADAGVARSGWRAGTASSGWHLAPGHFQYRAANDEQPNVVPDLIQYQHVLRERSSPVLDDYGYNQNVSRKLNGVTDLMLQLELVARGQGQVCFLAEAHGHRYEVSIQPAEEREASVVRLRQDGETVDEAHVSKLLGERVEIEFSLIDRQMILAIDGYVVFQTRVEGSNDSEVPTMFSMYAHGMDADLYDVRIWRDIYYTRPRTALWAIDEPFMLGADEYFVLGDNSPISADSRNWARPGLASKHIVGKPIRTQRKD